jgi:hypothetical protein
MEPLLMQPPVWLLGRRVGCIGEKSFFEGVGGLFLLIRYFSMMKETMAYEDIDKEYLQKIEEKEAEGVEPDAEEEGLSDPFDPDQISINSKVISMETCLRRLTQNTINLNPDFQRQEVWTPEKKSQLIESLMLKIPLPMFYVSSDEQGNFTVVDGLQRLSTIRDFVLGQSYLNSRNESDRGKGFSLERLEFWTKFNGETFDDLPIHLQNRILETEFSFTIINPGTPEEVKRNIFKRINTGGLPLSAQEIRNALYLGPSTKLLKKMAQSDAFLHATAYSVRNLRMEAEELILRFVSFLVRDFKTYRRTIGIDRYLSETMIIINAHPEYESRDFQKLVEREHIQVDDINRDVMDQILPLFQIGMKRSHELFGRHCFRKSYGGRRRSPINKALFEMWGVLLSQISEEAYRRLFTQREALMESYRPLIDNYDFQIMISRDSMKNYAVKDRFIKIKGLIEQFSQ